MKKFVLMAIVVSECFMIKLYYKKKGFRSEFDRLVDILYRVLIAYSAQIHLFVVCCPDDRPA